MFFPTSKAASLRSTREPSIWAQGPDVTIEEVTCFVGFGPASSYGIGFRACILRSMGHV